MHLVKSVAVWAVAAREAGASAADLKDTNVWTLQATFSTLTNVNFSEDRICDYIRQGTDLQSKLQRLVKSKGGKEPDLEIANLHLNGLSNEELEEFGHFVGVPARAKLMGQEDCFSLNEIATYGIKGAYCMM